MAEAQALFSSKEKNIQGIGYTVTGEGANVLVLLRGLARWSAHWLGIDQRFAKEGFKVVCVDTRGFGTSAKAPLHKDLKIHDFARDLAMVLSVEAPQGAHVVGVSLGGMIAISLGAMFPQLVKSLVIINSSLAASGFKRLTPKAFLAIVRVALGQEKAYVHLASVLLGPNVDLAKRDELAEKWSKIDLTSKLSVSHVAIQMNAARQFKGLKECTNIRCPVLVIRSDGDHFIDPRNSDFIHKQLPGSKLTTHASAGHELAFDDPHWLVAQVKDWAKEQSTGNHRLN